MNRIGSKKTHKQIQNTQPLLKAQTSKHRVSYESKDWSNELSSSTRVMSSELNDLKSFESAVKPLDSNLLEITEEDMGWKD